MSEQQGLEATIRDALTAEQRCGNTLHAPPATRMGGDPAWCRLPRGHDGPCAFFDPAAVAALAVRAAESYWVGDEQVTRAARVQFDLDKRHAPNLTDLVWDALPEETKEPFLADARAVLGALVQGDTP
jgi:hypothetical protein